VTETADLLSTLDHVIALVADGRTRTRYRPVVRETGSIAWISEGVAGVSGLPEVEADEIVQFPGGRMGVVFNLDPAEVGIVLLDHHAGLEAGDRVERTGRELDVPVGDSLLGRVVDAIGRPLDEGGPLFVTDRWPVERQAPAILDRAPVTVPLQTGIKVVDALVPIGRGQRELIIGDRETGKTSIAVDTMLNQADDDVMCIYCATGRRASSVARVIARLREHRGLARTIVVVAAGDDPPGLQFVAPYAAMTMAEYFMERGHDVLIVFDDLTRHARAYRELSLLLRRPPGREAYPGDIFHIHARLLERSAQLTAGAGGGSITALPIVETQAQNLAAYIPTNLISITDGQIYLSPALFQRGVLPAVDVGRSVSRVGGAAQLPAYRSVTGRLRLSYSQFQELEQFSRFAAHLDEDTRRTLEHGRRVREVLKQPEFRTVPVAEQIAVLLAAAAGILDDVPASAIDDAESRIRTAVRTRLPSLCRQIAAGGDLADDSREALLDTARQALTRMTPPDTATPATAAPVADTPSSATTANGEPVGDTPVGG